MTPFRGEDAFGLCSSLFCDVSRTQWPYLLNQHTPRRPVSGNSTSASLEACERYSPTHQSASRTVASGEGDNIPPSRDDRFLAPPSQPTVHLHLVDASDCYYHMLAI
jgi:hypothetical protein